MYYILLPTAAGSLLYCAYQQSAKEVYPHRMGIATGTVDIGEMAIFTDSAFPDAAPEYEQDQIPIYRPKKEGNASIYRAQSL